MVADGYGWAVNDLAVGCDRQRAGAVEPHAKDGGIGPLGICGDRDGVGVGQTGVVGERQRPVCGFMGNGTDRGSGELPRGGGSREEGQGDECAHVGDIARSLCVSAFHFRCIEINVDVVAVGIKKIDLYDGHSRDDGQAVIDGVRIEKCAEIGEACGAEGEVFEAQVESGCNAAVDADEVDVGVIPKIKPCARKAEIGAFAGVEIKDGAVKGDHLVELRSADVDVVEGEDGHWRAFGFGFAKRLAVGSGMQALEAG